MASYSRLQEIPSDPQLLTSHSFTPKCLFRERKLSGDHSSMLVSSNGLGCTMTRQNQWFHLLPPLCWWCNASSAAERRVWPARLNYMHEEGKGLMLVNKKPLCCLFFSSTIIKNSVRQPKIRLKNLWKSLKKVWILKEKKYRRLVMIIVTLVEWLFQLWS